MCCVSVSPLRAGGIGEPRSAPPISSMRPGPFSDHTHAIIYKSDLIRVCMHHLLRPLLELPSAEEFSDRCSHVVTFDVCHSRSEMMRGQIREKDVLSRVQPTLQGKRSLLSRVQPIVQGRRSLTVQDLTQSTGKEESTIEGSTNGTWEEESTVEGPIHSTGEEEPSIQGPTHSEGEETPII